MVGAKVDGDKLGLAVVGASVAGDFEGGTVGFVDGDFDGLFVTGFVGGLADGSEVTGLALGLTVGSLVLGASVGRELGPEEGGCVGSAVGFIDGLLVGPTLGLALGDAVVVIAGVNAGSGLLVAKPSQSISKSFDGNFCCPFSSSVPPPVKKNWVNGLELMSIKPSLEFRPLPPPASFLPPCFF